MGTALASLPAGTDVVIVPLLLSRGYHLDTDIRNAALKSGRTVSVANPLGPDPRLAELLSMRLADTDASTDDRIVLGAAGSSNPGGISDAVAAASLLAQRLQRPIATAFLSAAEPRLVDAVRLATRDPRTRVAVVTYLLAPGYFADLARRVPADVVTEPLLLPDAAPHPLIVDVAVDRFAEAVQRLQHSAAALEDVLV